MITIRIAVEDSRTGKLIKLDVKEHHKIERIDLESLLTYFQSPIDIIIKHMGIISAEQRSYTLVLAGRELPPTITIEDAVHKFGLNKLVLCQLGSKENDKLALWARVVGGAL